MKSLVVFTKGKRTTDKFLTRSVSREEIVTPDDQKYLEDTPLTIFDDLTPLGIIYPTELIDRLRENQGDLIVLNAQELAERIVKKLPSSENLTVMSGGGILAYLFLRNAGYNGGIKGIIDISRTYPEGSPVCELLSRPSYEPDLIIDDIIASGQTLLIAVEPYQNTELEIVCLLSSSNIPVGERGYRRRNGSTIPGAKRLYCPQFVNGPRQGGGFDSKPSILSLRYLLTRAIDDEAYCRTYLASKFGGLESALEMAELMRKVDRTPIDLLRNNPMAFLERYEGKK